MICPVCKSKNEVAPTDISYCEVCQTSYYIRAAQRHAAAVSLVELRRARDSNRMSGTPTDNKIADNFNYAIRWYSQAIFDCGISRFSRLEFIMKTCYENKSFRSETP